MKKRYRIISLALCALCLLSSLSLVSCSDTDKGGKISVVTTIFPEYDWVRQIIGEENESIDLSLIVGNGVDLHSYQPTTADIVNISSCDMFIYIGGESDSWVEDALENKVNDGMIIVNLLDVLGNAVVEEEIVDGMQEEQHEGHEDHEETEYDEHVWLSLKNAKIICSYIADRLTELDPNNAEVYTSNKDAYISELDSMDEQYASAVESAELDTLVFADRFPFRYLAVDYGLDYYAAFPGCSAETEASFETVVFLANKLDELGLECVMKIESSDGSLANTVISSSSDKTRVVLTLDSMQSVTMEDIENGTTYISVMKDNLEALRQALDRKEN